MAVTRGALGEQRIAINDVLYQPAWELGEIALQEHDPDLVFDERSDSEEMSENKGDGTRWRSQRSWHGGAGQNRYDSPASNPAAFKESKGVDVFTTPGDLTLLRTTSRVITNANEYPNAPQHLAVTDEYVFAAVGKPNVKRFSVLDASDVATLDYMATESPNVEVYDMATDGAIVYVALAASGVHRSVIGTTTTLDVHDATTNWTASSGSLSADTTTMQEGTGSLQWATTAANTTVTITNTRNFASAQDFSAVTLFKVWYQASSTGATINSFKLRLQTSANNYYEATIATGDEPWTEYTIAKESFSTTGSPAWNNINTAIYVQNSTYVPAGGTTTVRVDHLRSYTPTAFSHYSNHDARVLGWGKDRLFAMGLKSGTTHRFFEVGATTASVERDELPDGYVGTAIAELGGHVYYSYYKGPRSIISSWDGSTPEIAVQLPLGETVLSMAALANGEMLIGARRIGSTSNTSGQGVLYVGKPTGDGQLELRRITVLGTDDGKDHGIRSCYAWGDFGLFTWSYADSTTSGLGIYDPSTGGFARHVHGGTTDAAADDVVVFKGRRIFTRSGDGVYVEGSTYVASGTLTSSTIDWNFDKAKMLLQAEAGFLPLTTDQQVAIAYSTDNGTTFTTASTASAVADEVATGNIRAAAKQVQLRATLTSGASATTTPTVKKMGVSAIYGYKPPVVVEGYLRAHDDQGPARTSLATIKSNLRALRSAVTVVDVQTPEWESSSDTIKAVISEARVVRKWNPQDKRMARYVYFRAKGVPG